MGNGNSAISKARGQEANIASTKPQNVSRQGKPSTKKEVVIIGAYSEHHGKKSSLDNDDTFTKYIQRAKYKIRSLSNIGRGREQSNPAPDVANDTNNKENQNDQFSDFILHAKKKLRIASRIGHSSSLKRGSDH